MNGYVERLTLIAGPRPGRLTPRDATVDCLDLHLVLAELNNLRRCMWLSSPPKVRAELEAEGKAGR